MANNNQIELVVTVEVDRANKSIKAVNASLSSMEAAATKSARGASQGIDGMTTSMVKGATAGNLLAEGIKTALGWLKEMTLEVAKYAARTEVMSVVTNKLAEVNGHSAQFVGMLVDRIKQLGITTQESHGVVQRMIFAELDLAKATELARVAQDAAVISNTDSSQSLENIILGITTGQTRLLHTMGLQVSLEQTIQEEEKKLGRSISETEKRSAMLNKVLQEGVKIRGSYEAAMEKVGKQMTSLPRYFAEAKNAIGEQFLPEMRKVIDGLKELAVWLKDNAALVRDIAKAVAAAAAMIAAAALATKIAEIGAALGSLAAFAAANPIGLIAAGFVAAGAIIYSEWRKMEQPFREMDLAYQKWLTGQITGAKTGADLKSATDKVEKSFAAGAITAKEYAQAMDMLDAAQARVYKWGSIADFSKNLGLDIKIPDPKAEAAAAAALAEATRKEQISNEKAFRDRALEAAKAGLTGFAKDVSDVNAEIGKRTVMVDDRGVSHPVALTKKAWASIIEEIRYKFDAFKQKFAKDNREHLAEYLKGEEEAAEKRREWESRLHQQRLQNDVDVASRNLENLRDAYAFQEQRAGFERDARLRQLEGSDAQTLQQKVAVEQQKAAIEIDYLQKVHEVKRALYDMDTRRMLLEEELTLTRLKYKAEEIKARIAELTEQRRVIREQGDEANDAAIQAARDNATKRTTQLVREHNRQIFDSLKQQAGGVFDALLTKSQSVWKAIANSFKTAILTAIKEVVTSRVAAMLMQMFTGQKVSFAGGGAGLGGSGGMLSGLGGLLGIGAVPVLGGMTGGWTPGSVAPPGGMAVVGGGGMTQQQAAQIILGTAAGGGGGAAGGGGGVTSKAGVGILANLKQSISGWKDLLTNLGNIGFKPERWSMDEAGNMTKLANAKGVGGMKGGAMLTAGAMLAMDGLRRGGKLGVAETTGGGALIGAKFGGPLGAAIGAIAGFAAGMVRLFVKGAVEKARDKIKNLYGVDISDKAVLRQIVDIAKQSYGGNLDMAIRTAQVRDLIQLYAMSTGQQTKGMPAQVHPLDIVQSGGSLYQSPGYSNGTALPGMGGLPALDSIGGGVASGASPLVIQLDGPATTSLLRGEAVQAIASNPRVVQSAVMSASKSNAGRRELTSLQLSPGLVTS